MTIFALGRSGWDLGVTIDQGIEGRTDGYSMLFENCKYTHGDSQG